MKKGYLYLASDGIQDYKKFGITENLDRRLISYNTTEHLRPIFFEKVFEFDDYLTAMAVENTLRDLLKKYITQTNHIETFIWNKETESIFNNFVVGLNSVSFKNEYVGNLQNEKYPYYENLIKLIEKGLNNGIERNIIEQLIIQTKVGYYRENAPKRVVMENRVKHLIQLSDRELCWDNKPRILDRMSRLYNFEEQLNKIIENANILTIPRF